MGRGDGAWDREVNLEARTKSAVQKKSLSSQEGSKTWHLNTSKVTQLVTDRAPEPRPTITPLFTPPHEPVKF